MNASLQTRNNLIPLFLWLMHWGIFLFIQQNPDHTGDDTAGMFLENFFDQYVHLLGSYHAY